jgi:hypothetical protein
VKRFAELSEQEILALAITNEDEDSRIYRGFAEGLREKYPASAKVLDEMAEEEVRGGSAVGTRRPVEIEQHGSALSHQTDRYVP